MIKQKKSSLQEALLWDTLGLLVSSGVPILQALNVLKETFPKYSAVITDIHSSVREGDSISGALNKYEGSFHPIVYPLLDIGEQTGAFPETLSKSAELIRKEIDYSVNLRKAVGTKDFTKLIFYTSSAVLVDAGLPLLRTLRVSERIPALKDMRNDLSKICESVEQGSTFSEAMKNRPKYFNSFDANMVKAGEIGGALEVVLKRLADYTERRLFDSKKYHTFY